MHKCLIYLAASHTEIKKAPYERGLEQSFIIACMISMHYHAGTEFLFLKVRSKKTLRAFTLSGFFFYNIQMYKKCELIFQSENKHTKSINLYVLPRDLERQIVVLIQLVVYVFATFLSY